MEAFRRLYPNVCDIYIYLIFDVARVTGGCSVGVHLLQYSCFGDAV